MFPWDKHIKIWQLVGAVLAVPAGIAGTYSVYRTYVVGDVSCDSLRSSIIAILDRNLDPEAKRALLQKDVADFDTHCGAKDTAAKIIFDAAIAPHPPTAASNLQMQPAVAASTADSFGLSRRGERRGWTALIRRHDDGRTDSNFDVEGVPVTANAEPPAIGAVLTARTLVTVWFEAPPQGRASPISELQGRVLSGSCVKVLARGAAGRPYWAEVEPLPCPPGN